MQGRLKNAVCMQLGIYYQKTQISDFAPFGMFLSLLWIEFPNLWPKDSFFEKYGQVM